MDHNETPDDKNLVNSNSEDLSKEEDAFAKPKLLDIAPKSGENFKKPVLIGPRKGFKKNLTSSSKDSDKNKPNNESNVNHVTQNEPKEIAAFPLVISDFSDKKLPPDFPYTEPNWKGEPEVKYYLEELKSGVIEKEIDMCGRSFTVLGRLDHCHVTMAHPTISRYHAVLQYRSERQGIYDKGFYLYDLGSTHGTFLNKNRVKPQTYIRIQVGHVMKFGCSTRMFILQGPSEDEEPESEFTVTELYEMRRQELAERERIKEEEKMLKQQQEEKLKAELESRGVDWGMGEDADEETDLSENPYAVTTNEELYVDDPKKELKKWFEREGDELNLETEQVERGKMLCRVTLPLDNGKGGEVIIESTGKSKKEATHACALEACRYIDRLGLFRQSHQEAKKRQVRNWEENDYYDSDEDSYFDRTGTIDEKRQKRMKKAGKVQDNVETYDTLMKKHEGLVKKIAELEKKYSDMTSTRMRSGESNDDDELDMYMKSLDHKPANKLEIRMCQVELKNLKEEENRLVNLINIAKPASLPELKPYVAKKTSVKTEPCSSQTQQPTVTSSSQQLMEMDVKDDAEQKQVKTRQVIGPSLPPPEMESTNEDVPKKSKRSRTRQRDRGSKVSDSNSFDADEYNDLTWQPPQGQTGDGRTSLNDKYGY